MDQSGSETTKDQIAANVLCERLANGLTLIVKENPNSAVGACVVLVKAGYFNEPDHLTGITHVIEHMVFKGTPRRPEEDQFAREIRELGGVLNASTYYDQTAYHFVVPSEHLDHALEIQADAIQNARIDEASLAREIEVIVQESLQKRDNPNAMLVESLYELAFDQHHIRRWRIGHPETLRAITRDDILGFMRDTYRPENIIISVVSNQPAEEVKEMLVRQWGRFKRGELKLEVSPTETHRTDFRYKRLSGDIRQRLLLFAFRAPAELHRDAAPMMVLSGLLSDGRSARLYQKLREQLRVANSSWSSYESFDQFGIFLLGADSLTPNPEAAERALWSEIVRLQYEPVGEDELKRIKVRVESQRLFAEEEVLGLARTLAAYEAIGGYELVDTVLDRIRAVTADDVMRVANSWINLEGAALVEYLPAQDNVPESNPDKVIETLYDAQAHTEVLDTAPPSTVHESRVRSLRTSSNAFEGITQTVSLPWGGHLFYKIRRDLPLVSITALFQGGRRGETISNCGITNLMLKSTLKGTQRFTAEQIVNRIEGLGSSIGLVVTSDYFGFTMKVKRDVLAEAFEIFAEVVARPIFPPDEVEREKQAVLADIRRQQDSIGSLAMDLFSAAYYGEDHPYGLPAVGTVEAIQPVMRTDVMMWHQRHAIAQNLVVGLVGDVEEADAVALFTDLLERRTSSRAERLPVPLQGKLATPDRVLYRQKQQTAAVLGFHGAGLYNEDRHIIDVLTEIVSGMGGRFFRAVRGDNALAYQVAAIHRVRQESGNFITYALTSPENEEVARDLILRECELLMNEPVTSRELESAKVSILGQYVIGTQTFGAQSAELASIGIYGLPMEEPQNYLDRVMAVTEDDLMDVAQRYLDPRNSWLGVVRGGAVAQNV